MEKNIGFVGASGLMGHGMAKNILAAGFPLAITVRRTPVPDLVDAGARVAADHAELGRTCDVVVLCVTTAEDVAEVVAGLLTEPKDGLIIVDTSTSEPAVTLALAADCARQGVRFVDAPLTRTPVEAEKGTLNSIVGADDDTLAEVRPVLEAYSENILHCGPTGSGHVIKLLNNFVFQAGVTALSEAFVLAAKAGSDPKTLVEIMKLGAFNNALLANMAKTLDGDFGAMKFALANAGKDVRYYTRLAGEYGVPSPVGAGTNTALATAIAQGYGEEYFPIIVKAQAELNDVEL